MVWKSLRLRLSGKSFIAHNGQLANPLNKFTKSLKEVTSKRSKTDADFERMAQIEFCGSLYMNGAGPCIPAEMIEAAAVAGAKKVKAGPKAKAGLVAADHAALEYEGPRTADELWANEDFRLVAGVKVNNSRVMRTRPIFKNWSAVIEIEYDDTMANESSVIEWFQRCGAEVGIGDWRPKHGRFRVEQVV